MDAYVTGNAIRGLREARGLTQAALAAQLSVSDKAVSRWETGRGYPDITLLQPLAEALGVSLPELFQGGAIRNQNRSGNLRRLKFYVCPVCGNMLHSTGEAMISCCGVRLPPLEAEQAADGHLASVEPVEDEWYVSVPHPMEREHHISFLAVVTDDRLELKKLYPEGDCAARFPRLGYGMLYLCCNRHGLYRQRLP